MEFFKMNIVKKHKIFVQKEGILYKHRIHWQNAQIHELDQNYKVLLEIHKLKQT